MNLIKEKWNDIDGVQFNNYLKSFENKEKKEWCTNILKTNLPVLVIKTEKIKEIIDNIYQGNYLSFLDLMLWDYYENTTINGFLISRIDDFNVYKKYLDVYSNKADNWATCDLLTFNIKGKEKEFLDLSKEYCQSKKPFVRRIGLYILFGFINNESLQEIFALLDTFTNEEDYYVNMMGGWLLSECIIQKQKETLLYLKKSKACKKIINKAIQKCRESRRVTQDDKEMLLEYKVKKK